MRTNFSTQIRAQRKRVEFEEEEGTETKQSFCVSGSDVSEVSSDEGQAIKSARGMPWHQEPKKDATSCDKPRGAAHTL